MFLNRKDQCLLYLPCYSQCLLYSPCYSQCLLYSPCYSQCLLHIRHVIVNVCCICHVIVNVCCIFAMLWSMFAVLLWSMLDTSAGLLGLQEKSRSQHVKEGDLVQLLVPGVMRHGDPASRLQYTMMGYVDRVAFKEFSVEKLCSHCPEIGKRSVFNTG